MGSSIIPVAGRNAKIRALETVQPSTLPSQTRTKIPRDFVFQDMILNMQAQMDISGGTTSGTVTAEQPFNLIRGVRLEANSPGRPTVAEIKNADFAALATLERIMNGTTAQNTALANGDVQAATIIDAKVELPFYIPRCKSPFSAALNCHELASLDLVIDWGSETDLVTGGDRTEALTNISCQVSAREWLSQEANAAKYAVNLTRYMEFTGLSQNSAYLVDLKRGLPIRGLLIKQFTRAAGTYPHVLVNSVINALKVEVNGIPKFEFASNGTANSGWNLLRSENKRIYSLETQLSGYAFIDFLEDGDLSGLIKTAEYTSINLSLDINTVSDSVIRVYPVEIVDRNM